MLPLLGLLLALQLVVLGLLLALRQQLRQLGEQLPPPPAALPSPPEATTAPPAPPQTAPPPAPVSPVPAGATAALRDPLVVQFNQQVNLAAELPIQMVEALTGADPAGAVALRAGELDAALYRRWEASELLAAGLPAEQAERLTEALATAQSAAIERLAAHGLRRIATSSGSPFEPLRVVPDPDQPPRWTDRPELDGRVAAVAPGRGGWELAGQVVCPTRAQRYVYRGESAPTDR
ncbi:MAG: hypothetical protein IT204_09180 [Fimbriimonadaceae bacterium]|nr:hypothetical protein [Fimbriimonadaceae bacterium]